MGSGPAAENSPDSIFVKIRSGCAFEVYRTDKLKGLMIFADATNKKTNMRTKKTPEKS